MTSTTPRNPPPLALARMLRASAFLCAVTAATSALATAPPFVFVDDFEQVAADGFRVDQLLLRDPHLFANVFPFGCTDATELVVNPQIGAALSADEDGDGLFDASVLLLFRPFDASGRTRRVDWVAGDCLADPDTPGCTVAVAAQPVPTNYAAFDSGTCLAPVAGTVRPYAPAVPVIATRCLTTAARPLSIAAGPLSLPLRAVRLAASLPASPNAALSPGLLRGFLAESDAEKLLLPAELPVIGGRPLAALLPGGAGSCEPGDDRDVLDGDSGWWFYFELAASPVPMVEAAAPRTPPIDSRR